MRITIASTAVLICFLLSPAIGADKALSFTTETVDATPGSGQYASIAMDSQGRVWIGYTRALDAYSREYRLAVREPGGWTFELVNPDVTTPTRLVLMPGDVPGVAWPAPAGVTFVSRPGAPGTPWVGETISDGFSPWAAQIECDRFGRVHAYNHWSYHYYGVLAPKRRRLEHGNAPARRLAFHRGHPAGAAGGRCAGAATGNCIPSTPTATQVCMRRWYST